VFRAQNYFDSLSGAGAWFASRQALQNFLAGGSAEDTRASIYRAFDEIDMDRL